MSLNNMQTDDPTLLELSRRIALESDVQRVLKLEQSGNGFRYMIETVYFAYPRYIIGSTDDAAVNVRREFLCGLEEEALAKWDQLQGEHQLG